MPARIDNLEGRDVQPHHFTIKIETFSTLLKASIEKYSFCDFEAGDYKWKLSIYPHGNKKRLAENHISISLSLVETSSLPPGWEVNAVFKLFIYDQLHDKYFTLQDDKVRRFHAMKTEWGVANFINLDKFKDPSNGFLVDDACVFGAEVFVLKSTRKGDCLSMLEEPTTSNYVWKVKGLTSDRYDSDMFIAGDYKWWIILFPRGFGIGKGTSISTYLALDESTLPRATKVFAKFTFRLVDQINGEHFETNFDHLFGPPVSARGSPKFFPLVKLKDVKKGLLVDDTCTIEAQVTVLGTIKTK